MLVEKKTKNLNEKSYQFLIDNILDVVIELDLNGIFTYVNPYIYDELGYQPDEIIGRKIYEFVHPDDAKKITKVLLRRSKSHGFISEIRLKNDKNQFIWYEIKARRIKDYDNQRKILLILKNISKVKLLEEKLEKKEENYQKITNSIPEIKFWKVLTPSKYERAIHTTSEMLKVIIENIPQCVFWKDTNFKYLGCNGNYSEFIGIEHPESIIGKTDENLLPNKENIQQFRENETSVMLLGKPLYHTHESWIIENGENNWLDINRVPLIDIKGDVNGILVTFEEITDRKIAEEKLRNSEKKYKNLSSELETIMDIIPSMIFVKNKSSIYTRVNQVFADYLKLEKEDIIGKSTFDLFTQEVATNLKRDDLEVIKNGIPKLNIEKTVEFPVGKVSGIISKMPYYNEKDEINGVIGFAIDISERKELEQRLIKSEERYRELANLLPQVICETDERGNLTFVNDNAYSVFGYTPDDFNKGLNALLMLIPEDRKRAMENIKRVLRGKEEEEMRENEYTALRKDGSTFPVMIYSSPIIFKDTSVGTRSIIIDITDQKNADQRLKESEEQLRLERDNLTNILNSMKDGVYIVNQNYDIEFVNPVLIEEFGPFELKKCFEYFHDREEVCPWCKNQDVFAGKTVRWEWYSFKNQKTYDLVDTLLKNPDGSISILEIFHDITDRKNNEKKIIASEKKYRQLIESAQEGIWIIDKDAYTTFINPKMTEMLGYTQDEMFGKHLFDFMDEKSVAISKRYLERRKQGIEEQHDFEFLRKNGTKIYTILETSPLTDESGEYDGAIAFISDITERKKTEQQLKESEEKYRILIETANMGLVEFDVIRNKVSYINPKLLDILGYKKKELLDEKIFMEIVHPEDLENLIISREDKNVEFRIVTKDGKIKWLSGIRNNLFNKEGKLISARLWLQDFTESKEVEEIKSNLLTRFSHEFKTPLISIKGFADFLLTEYKVNLDEKILSFLRRIKEGSNRLEALINSFIESSQLEKTVIQMNLKQEDVSDLVQEVLLELEGYIGMREHTINVSLYEKLITTIDKEKIYTVLSNILINAIDYTPQGGKISIKSSIDKNFLTISVKDNGIGLSEEEKNCLFKPFGKIERYGKGWDITIGGMGMGLYISKEIIELHGGKIWVESEGRSKGSEFHFSLPIK